MHLELSAVGIAKNYLEIPIRFIKLRFYKLSYKLQFKNIITKKSSKTAILETATTIYPPTKLKARKTEI